MDPLGMEFLAPLKMNIPKLRLMEKGKKINFKIIQWM